MMKVRVSIRETNKKNRIKDSVTFAVKYNPFLNSIRVDI